jgi:hypothetical protein
VSKVYEVHLVYQEDLGSLDHEERKDSVIQISASTGLSRPSTVREDQGGLAARVILVHQDL